MTCEADEMLTTKAQSEAATELRSRRLANVESLSAVASGCERNTTMNAVVSTEDQAIQAAHLERVGAIGPVSITLARAKELLALADTAPELWAACNKIVSQAQAIETLNGAVNEAEQEASDARTQLAAAEEEIEQLRADLRVATGCP